MGVVKKNGLKFWNKAKKIIPGGNSLISKRPERYAPDIWPVYFSKAKGCHVWDIDNVKYFEAAQMSVGASILGYANNQIDTKVKKFISKGNISTLNALEEYYLARLLINNNKFASKVKFGRSGGEAMAIAVRIARSVSKNQKILFSGYHGWMDWYLATNLQNKKNLDTHLIKGLSTLGVDKRLKETIFPFKYNSYTDLKKNIYNHNPGIIIVEGARYNLPSAKFVKLINSICKKKKIILIVDEITSGFRIGPSGSYIKTGFKPDIVVYGKGLGNGYAISAVLGNNRAMRKADEMFISSSNWTERVGFVAAIETLKFIKKKKIWININSTGKFIEKNWLKIFDKYKIKVSLGNFYPLMTFNLGYSQKINNYILTYFCQEMLANKIIASNSIYLSYAHKKKYFKKYFLIFDKIFKKISELKNIDEVKNLLKTRPRSDSFTRLT